MRKRERERERERETMMAQRNEMKEARVQAKVVQTWSNAIEG